MSTKIFLTGASGYIGGSVLQALLDAQDASKYAISVIVRSEDHVERVKTLGVRVIKGSLDDSDLLEKESSDADIVINTASSQHLPAAKNIAAGLAKRKAEGKPAFLIHTSGTSVVGDHAIGQFFGKEVYSDNDDLYALEKSDARYTMRSVDTGVIEAAEKGGFGASIIAPPTIYGSGTGLIKRTPHQVRMVTLAAIKTRQTKHIGAGLAAWTHVHIDDLSSLYVLLTDAARAGKAPTGREGYFFAETGEHTWKELSKTIASVLHTKNLVDSPRAIPFSSDQEAADLLADGSIPFAQIAFGTNSRVRAVRGREVLKWKPKHSDEHFFSSMEEQIDFIIEQDKPLSVSH